jgi:H+/gluconate symporter-like permease
MEIFIFVFILFLLILSIAKFNISPFLALLFFGLVYGIASGIGFPESLNLLLEGFAKTLR